jgi:hypothetical protein
MEWGELDEACKKDHIQSRAKYTIAAKAGMKETRAEALQQNIDGRVRE